MRGILSRTPLELGVFNHRGLFKCQLVLERKPRSRKGKEVKKGDYAKRTNVYMYILCFSYLHIYVFLYIYVCGNNIICIHIYINIDNIYIIYIYHIFHTYNHIFV